MVVLCPEDCWCDKAGIRVACYGLSLKHIPLHIPIHVNFLTLNWCNITSLEEDSFISRGLTDIKYLRVKYCGLETIDFGAFNGLTKLRKLSMSGNKISEIIPRTFEKMSLLQELDLTNNRLQYLEVDVFVGLVNVRYLYLNGNKLQYVHPDLFVGLPNLKELELNFNYDLHIPTDSQFINSNSLIQLSISDCNVNSVSGETFANVSALEWLDLSFNSLSSVDINILKVLPKLSALYLYGNWLQCSCRKCGDGVRIMTYRQRGGK
jgi:Leucine-rich repeat (LRR) protein